jgi:hypothetical protein
MMIFSYEVSGQSIYDLKPFSFTSRTNDEVVTSFSPEGIIISSNRSSSSFLSYTDREKRNFFNIYEIRKNENGDWESPVLFSPYLKTPQNDGPATLNENGDLIVFTRNFSIRKFGNTTRSNPYLGLFLSEKVNDMWINVRAFEHNTSDRNTTHPSLSSDGTKLFFASDRAGGFGGYDLYYSELTGDKWSVPVNLGPKVNTASNELYPFLHSSGRLYFSSNGQERAGGYDLYYTEYYENEWFSPIKLPPPFNSSLNDFTIIIDDNFENGFITSSRRGSLDIFRFESTLPSFEVCQQQKTDNYCFVFYERSTMEIDTSLYKYRWDLGDGTTVEAIEAEHCFKGPGNYNIKLDVIDVLTKEIMFNQAEYELELVKTVQAYITCPDTIRIQDEIQFSGSESYFGSITPLEYYWDFGDSGRAVGETVKRIFSIPGKYNIKLGVIVDEKKPEEESLKKYCSYKSVIVIE